MTKSLSFNILVEKVSDDLFVARCLELDLIATSVDCEDVQGKMKKMIGRLVEFAAKQNRLHDIFRPAAQEVWEKFRSATRQLEQSERAIFGDTNGLSLIQSCYA